MKKNLLTSLLLIFCSFATNAQITSVANGNWTSPATWGGIPPTPGATVIINHAVTLDMDWGYTSGSITINAAGSLTGNSPARGMAISGGSITVNGYFDVSRVALYAGTATNSGTFVADSLYNATTLTNNVSGTIVANQFLIFTGGNFTNNGNVVSVNFLNMAAVSNFGTIHANDFMNSKSFTNANAAGVTANHNFLNSDSLATPAIFTNNGHVAVYNDWANNVIVSSTVNGTGTFCVVNNTYNSGLMTGNFDFCDQSGGNIDLNTGTIAGTITHCLFSCASGTMEYAKGLSVDIFPNPNNGIFSITIKNASSKLFVDLYSVLGEKVFSTQITNEKTNLDMGQQAKGIYFYQIKNENEVLKSGKIIVQ